VVNAQVHTARLVHTSDLDADTLATTAATAPAPLQVRTVDVTAPGAIDAVVAEAGTVDVAVHVSTCNRLMSSSSGQLFTTYRM
jgi:hypothetical protein